VLLQAVTGEGKTYIVAAQHADDFAAAVQLHEESLVEIL
jgi:hypothetical protein